MFYVHRGQMAPRWVVKSLFAVKVFVFTLFGAQVLLAIMINKVHNYYIISIVTRLTIFVSFSITSFLMYIKWSKELNYSHLKQVRKQLKIIEVLVQIIILFRVIYDFMPLMRPHLSYASFCCITLTYYFFTEIVLASYALVTVIYAIKRQNECLKEIKEQIHQNSQLQQDLKTKQTEKKL